MRNIIAKDIIEPENEKKYLCLSCGTTENIGKRKYCSIECRQRLRHNLNVRTGLLKALNTRYATFYFTEQRIIMDLIPFDSKAIYSFIFPRSVGKKPAEDFCNMSDILGNVWWAEKKRTNKKYLAARHVFDQAQKNNILTRSVKPQEVQFPTVKKTSLIHLKLNKSDLDTSRLQNIIKRAYRLQVKKHHPDTGGDSAAFIKIHQAYEELINWAERPTFYKRRGFPDRWFYDGEKNSWRQPAPGFVAEKG